MELEQAGGLHEVSSVLRWDSQKPGRDTKMCKRKKLGQGRCVEEAPEQGVMCELFVQRNLTGAMLC